MGPEYTFGKELKEASQLGEYYRDLASRYSLDYIPGRGYFIVLSNKSLSEDADHRKRDTPPWPGIKIHSPLSVEMYNILRSYDFIQMLKNREIDGIKVYLYEDNSTKHKEVTIYISPYSMPNLGKLLNILEKNGISIRPVLPSYHDMIYLNRMHIAPEAKIFVRYSTDFTGKMNISDIKNIRNRMMSNIDIRDINQVIMIGNYITDKYMSKIDDQVWRTASDILNPQIVAVSRSWLLNNQYNLDEILRNSSTSLKDFYYELWKNADIKELLKYPSTIYTFITLKKIEDKRTGEKIIAPDPNIIISYDDYNKQLEAYDVLNARINIYNLSNKDDLEKISNHPNDRLYHFLKYGPLKIT
jgi:hypothetical protein